MTSIKEEGIRTILLCVDNYESGVLSGCFYRGGRETGCEIRSLTQFLVGVDRLLEPGGQSCSGRLKRSFCHRRPIGGRLPDRQGLQRGRLATIEVRVLFHCHTSWQGTVAWVEEGREEIFRSALELILLLDSALGGCLEPGEGIFCKPEKQKHCQLVEKRIQ